MIKGSTRLSTETLIKFIMIIIVSVLAIWLILGAYGPVIQRLAIGGAEGVVT